MKKVLAVSALSALMASQAAIVPMALENKIDVIRVGGADRYDTAVKISKESYTKAENVVLADGEQFPDALAGGVLASVLDAPVLLTKSDKLTKITEEEISRLEAKNIYILGGENSVSKSIEDQLSKKYKVKRISGEDRYVTSLKIAKEIKDITKKEDVAVASGTQFADALSAAPAMAKLKMPIVLTDGNKNPEFNNKDSKYNVNTSDVKYVIGGERSVPNKFVTATRIAGEDRFKTSTEVAKTFFKDSKDGLLANGMLFPDGLSAISLAKKKDAPILLSAKSTLPDSVFDYIRNNSFKSITIIGGETSVPKSIEEKIVNLGNEASLEARKKELQSVVDAVNKNLDVIDKNYVAVIPDKMKAGEDQAKAKERIKADIKERIKKAQAVLDDKNADEAMYNDVLKLVKPENGLIGGNFMIKAEVEGEKVVNGLEELKNSVEKDAAATTTTIKAENTDAKKDENIKPGTPKYVRIKEENNKYTITLKTEATGFVRDDNKENTDASKVKKYIKIEAISKESFDKENKDSKVYKETGKNVDVISSPTRKYESKVVKSEEKVEEKMVDNYTVTPKTDGYIITINKLPENTVAVKPIMVDDLGAAGALKYGDLVFIEQK